MDVGKNEYLILCANICHPSGGFKYSLLVDDDDNAVVFDSERGAKAWCKANRDGNPFAYVILNTQEFIFI